MIRRIGLGLLWLGFCLYAFGFAPPDQPDTLDLIQRLIGGPWDGINPAVIALFNLMGIWPLVYTCILVADGRGQKFPAWPFLLGSFFLGAFALLPYLALRQPSPEFVGPVNRGIKLWESRGLALSLFFGGIGLLAYGVLQGNWPDFVQQWQTSRFIHVMSLDFCLLTLLFPVVLEDDLRRRGLDWSAGLAWVGLIPFLGPLLYLWRRPPLQLQSERYPEIQSTTPESA